MLENSNEIREYIKEKVKYLSLKYNYTFSDEEISNLVNYYSSSEEQLSNIKYEIDEKVSELVSLLNARINEPYDYKMSKTFYSATLDTGEVIPIATYHISDNELHLHSAIPNNDEGRLQFERLRQYIRDKYNFNRNLTDEEIKRLAKVEYEDKIIEDVLCSLLPILEKNKHLSSVSLETNEYFARYVSDVFRSYGFSWEKRSDGELEELKLGNELSKDRTDILKCDRKLLIENIKNRDKKISMTLELETIFDRIIKDASKSSRELLDVYIQDSKYIELKDRLEKKDIEYKGQLRILRQQNINLSDGEFFYSVVSQKCKEIIELIKYEYGDKLPLEILSKYDNFNLDIIYDEEFDHDITAHPDEGKISINMAHFTKGENLDIIEKTARAVSTMPHELFHFMFRILKNKKYSDERFVYKLTNGETVSSHGGFGHMINEGLAEYYSSNFCEKYNLFYGLNPSYIGFSDLCKYFCEKGNISEEFFMKNDIDGIISCFSPEVLSKYKETERLEFCQNFKIKKEGDIYRYLSIDEIANSYSEKKVSVAKKLQEEKLVNNSDEEKTEEAGKVLTLKNPETNNSNIGKVNYIYIVLVILLIVIVGVLFAYFIK